MEGQNPYILTQSTKSTTKSITFGDKQYYTPFQHLSFHSIL